MLTIQSPDLYTLNGLCFDDKGNIYIYGKFREKLLSTMGSHGYSIEPYNFVMKFNKNNGEFTKYNDNFKSLKISQAIKNPLVNAEGYLYFYNPLTSGSTSGGLYGVNNTATIVLDQTSGYELLSINNQASFSDIQAKLKPTGEILLAGNYDRWTISEGKLIYKFSIAIDSTNSLTANEYNQSTSDLFNSESSKKFWKFIQLDESYYLLDMAGNLYSYEQNKLIQKSTIPTKHGEGLLSAGLMKIVNNNNKYIFTIYNSAIASATDIYINSENATYYICKYDPNLELSDYTNINYKNSSIVDAWATSNGELIIAGKITIPQIINGLPNYTYKFFIEKFDTVGKHLSTLDLNYEVYSFHYNNLDDSIYAVEKHGMSNWDFNLLTKDPSNLDDSITIHKISSILIEDSNFTTPDYINSDRYISNGKYFAQDVHGNAGTTAKILGAVFGKDSVQNKQYVGIGLDLLDKGMDYSALAGLAVNAAGLKTNDEIVSTLWKNIVGTTASAADKAPFIELLENGMTVGDLAKLAAETTLNVANINLVGLASTGLEYTPVA